MSDALSDAAPGELARQSVQAALLRGRYFLPAALCLTVGLTWFSAKWPEQEGTRRITYGLAVAFFALSNLVLSWAKEHAENLRHDAQRLSRASVLTALRVYLEPCLTLLDQAVHAAAMDGNQHGVTAAVNDVEHGVLNAAQRVCGPETAQTRAIIFALKGARKDQLESIRYVGGCGRDASHKFKRNKSSGRKPWERALSGEAQLVNVREDPDWTDEAADTAPYEVFVTCGIIDSAGAFYGCINVDAPYPEDLSATDKQVLEILARTLAVAYSLDKTRVSIDADTTREKMTTKDTKDERGDKHDTVPTTESP